jgi:uncharacterized protein (TIGR03086 family)
MTGAAAQVAPPAGGVELLQRAIRYALGAIQAVTPERLSDPTPCQGWDLRMLLRHVCESVAALQEGLDTGRVALCPGSDDEAAADPARIFRARAIRLLDAWTNAARHGRDIDIADQHLADTVMAGAGALEIAVHGWDISQTCGHHQPIPLDLAVELLTIASLLVPETNRHPLFAAPVAVPETAEPSERLLAFLGRDVGGAKDRSRR